MLDTVGAAYIGALCGVIALFTSPVFAQQPLKIAEHVAERVVVDRSITIHEPGATFIKVHFEAVRSPVKVCSPGPRGTCSGSREVRKIAPGQYKQMTRHGEHVAALSIEGDTVIVELLGRGNVTIVGWDKGWTEQQIQANNPTTETFCGVDDSRPIECYKDSEPAVYERARPVGKLLIAGGGSCTTGRYGEGNMMITNNHCMRQPETIAASEVWFDWKYTTCGGTTINPAFKVPADQLLVTDFAYDFTLFTVVDSPELQAHGWLGLDVSLPEKDEELYIVNHLLGRPQSGLRASDMNTSGVCQVDIPSYYGRAPDSDFGFYCDSEGGQSGAPVSNYANHRVFGLHHFGNVGRDGTCANGAVKMSQIWPFISPFFGGVVPLGDNEAEVERPKSVPAASCVDNVCQYSGEGSIGDSFMWTLGDGTYSYELSGTHTYTAPGNVQLSLFATKNGVTDVQSVVVKVIVPGWNEPPRSRFTYTVDGLTAHFQDVSEDVDGEVVAWTWRIRDPIDNVRHEYYTATVDHTFEGSGEKKYVDLTVTDDGGKRSSTYFAYIDIPEPTPDPCGNGTCDTDETWESCPADCPPPPDPCGNGVCDAGETYLTCPVDCPPPEPTCGDGECNGSETHATCPADCEAPPPVVKPIWLTVVGGERQPPYFKAHFEWGDVQGESVTLRGERQTKVTPNDGNETLTLHNRDRGTYWRLCDLSNRCSNTVRVDY
jgi:PKD repeat protein